MSRLTFRLVVLLAVLSSAARLDAQQPRAAQVQASAGAMDELQVLDEEQKAEAAGDVARAQSMLEGVLDRSPGSLSALISLERLLRTQGRVGQVIPRVNALLKADATSPIGYQMLIRAYSAMDSLPALARAADAWIRATPRLETPYREIATVYRGRKDEQSALMVLQRGRARIGRQDALAFELGDLYAGMGNAANAADEWARAIGRDADGFHLVQYHLAALPDGGARIMPTLVDNLTAQPTTPARLRAAATLSVNGGLGSRAQAIVTQVAAGLKGPPLQNFLVEVARSADGAQLPGLAYWAYSKLLAAGGPQERMLAVRSRLAELALAAGDTAAARTNFAILEKASIVGAPERRQALALRIEMTARTGDAATAGAALTSFRQEFPDAGELDGLAAAVGNAYLARADAEGAARALAGVRGPRSSFALGRLYLLRGNVADARNALLAAAGGLQGSDATEAIALVSLLGRLSPEATSFRPRQPAPPRGLARAARTRA